MKCKKVGKWIYFTEFTDYEIRFIEKKLTWQPSNDEDDPYTILKYDDEENKINPRTLAGLLEPLREVSPYTIELENPVDEVLIPIQIPKNLLSDFEYLDFQCSSVAKAVMMKTGIIISPTGCFTGDAKISLLDGTEVEIKDLVGRKEFWVYSCTPDGEIVPGRGHSARVTKHVTELCEVTLDNNEVIKCTPDHRFMLREGTYKEAKDLKDNDSLMPWYFNKYHKYMHGKTRPATYDNKYKIWKYDHRWVYESLCLNIIPEVVHHDDENIYNNYPNNLFGMTTFEHNSLHSSKTRYKSLIPYYSDNNHQIYAASFVNKEKLKERGQIALINYNTSDKGRAESVNRAAHMRNIIKNISDKEKELIYLKRTIGTIKINCRRHHNNTPLNCEKCNSKLIDKQEEIKNFNHKIKSIKIIKLNHTIPVYDITVDKYHNFALSAGVFVHNSGKTEQLLGTLRYLLDNKLINTAIVVVPSIGLDLQIYERALARGFTTKEVCMLHGGSKTCDTPIVFGVINSLNNILKLPSHPLYDFIKNVDYIAYDEGHHGAADTWLKLATETNSKYLLYYSASPFKEKTIWEDPSDCVLFGITGRVIFSITQKYIRELGLIATPIVFFKTIKGKLNRKREHYQVVYNKFIVNNKQRNNQIVYYASKFAKLKFSVLILVRELDHAKALMKELKDFRTICVFGGSVSLQFNEEKQIEQVPIDYNTFRQEFESGYYEITIGSSVLDEGFDMPSVGAVISGAAGKSRIKLIQRLGRGSRRKKIGRNNVYLVDFYDMEHVWLLSQSKKRIELFQEIECIFPNTEIEFLQEIINHSLEIEKEKNNGTV